MLKFDNTHIFTGYLKQLLSSFNLPACKIYTKEFADYYNKHGKEDPRVIESFDTIAHFLEKKENVKESIGKKRIAYRLNYLKNDGLYHYFWPYNQDKENLGHNDCYWRQVPSIYYDEDKALPGLTKTLDSSGSLYDNTTHEYLGEYLRFMRDYYDVNLMSLYNCFSNTICNNLEYQSFNSQDSRYRIYALPVKLFQKYTIAIDCDQELEMFCGIYTTSLDTSKKFIKLIDKTYQRVSRSFFKQPFLYDKLDVKNWSFEQDVAINQELAQTSYPNLIYNENITRWDIAIREQDLKLFIKIPNTCKSSIVVLEGDYRGFNDFKYVPVLYNKNGAVVNSSAGYNEDELKSLRCIWEYKQNSAVVNFDQKAIDLNETSFTPISRLQLLAFNTGESYPFADRLIEYLSGSATTSLDSITDNVKRAQKVMNLNQHYFMIDGLWENKMQKIIYDYMLNSGPINITKDADGTLRLVDDRRGYHPRLGHTSKSMLFDVIGYVDRNAEKWYASWAKDVDKNGNTVAVVKDSIQNVDIYNGLFDI